MIDLRFADHLSAYVDVVRGGSFSSAARRRMVSPSAIVRQIDALEKALGVKLLVRSTRAVSPTDAGERLFERSQRIIDDLVDTHAEVLAQDGKVSGTLRIACAPTFGKRYVLPALRQLLADHPDLIAEIDISERLAEPVLDRLDAIIRVGDLNDSSLIATKLMEQKRFLVCSPSYLPGSCVINSLEDLSRLHFIDKFSGNDLLGWRDVFGANSQALASRRFAFRCNDFESLRLAAKEGLGIAFLPDWLVAADLLEGTLIRLSIDGEPWNRSPQGIYLLRTLSQPSAKVRALAAALREQLPAPVTTISAETFTLLAPAETAEQPTFS